jgi:hypothetical protein
LLFLGNGELLFLIVAQRDCYLALSFSTSCPPILHVERLVWKGEDNRIAVSVDCYGHLSFHLLAIPLFEESHSGESLYAFFAKVFDALCPTWKEKIIGSSTDGAPNMTGCNVGFTTRVATAAGNDRAFYRVWCLAHQLDLIVKASLHSIADTTAFPFMNTMTTIIGWLRRQDTLIRRMSSKCPYYINVRWTSVSKVSLLSICLNDHVTFLTYCFFILVAGRY